MKTQATFFYKQGETILDLDDFLRRVFYKKDSQERLVPIAKRILEQIISKDGLTSKAHKGILLDLNIGKTTYYSVLGRMEALDMIYKYKGAYRLRPQFSTVIRSIANWWETFYNRNKKEVWEAEQ